MANQRPDVETARDLEALPADLQPLYRRLTDDGAAWQAASAATFASLARTLVADVERIASDDSIDAHADDADDIPLAPPITLPVGAHAAQPTHRHQREWIVGTFAAVAVVALLALALQGALAGRGNTGPLTGRTGKWQILDKLTVKSASVAAQTPIIAPSNPQVAFEATNSLSGEGGKAVTFASLRRTDDGGATWHTLTLPLPLANVSTIQLQVSPVSARIVFMSLWDRTSISCEPTSGTVGEGCERGYVSYDSGDSWQTQTLPVRGILDLNQPLALQQNRMFASNDCNESACIHLLISADGGQIWQVADSQITAQGQHICNFVATPNAATVYVMAIKNSAIPPQPSCMLPASAMTLWRGDDAGSQWGASDEGTRWTQLAPPPFPTPGATQANQPFAQLLAAPEVGVVYLSVSHVSDGAGEVPVFVSDDYGATWKPTPTLPNASTSVLQTRAAAALHDGTLVFATGDSRSRVTVSTWRPGDTAWARLPVLPVAALEVLNVTVSPVGVWQNSVIVTLRQDSVPGKFTYYVVRYQM